MVAKGLHGNLSMVAANCKLKFEEWKQKNDQNRPEARTNVESAISIFVIEKNRALII